MCVSNTELNKINMNLNSSKTKKLTMRQLNNYYLYDEQILLDEGKFDMSFQSFYSLYIKDKESIRYDIYMHRILSNNIGLKKLSKDNQKHAKEILLEKEFLIFSNERTLTNIYKNLNDVEKENFINLLLSLKSEVKFNSYNYILKKFFEKNNINN